MSHVLEPVRPSTTKPDFGGKLLMRIRSLRWHAAAVAATSRRASTRTGAAAIVIDLDAMELAASDVRTAADATAGDLQIDGLGVRFAALGLQ